MSRTLRPVVNPAEAATFFVLFKYDFKDDINRMMSEATGTRLLVISGKPDVIAGLLQQVLSEVEAHNYGSDDIFGVHLALEEAVTNAVKHGNKQDTDKQVQVRYLVTDEKIEISVTDEGPGFDPQKLPDPRQDENLYKAGGRGVLLMRSYMDAVEYNAAGNCVSMVKYRKKAPCSENKNV